MNSTPPATRQTMRTALSLRLLRGFSATGLALLLWTCPVRGLGQLIVGFPGAVVAEDLTTGAAISSFHWTPPGSPFPTTVKTLTVFGTRLYVAYQPFISSTTMIGVYDATTGAVINANFASVSASGGLPVMAATADSLLVANTGSTIRKYDAATGALLNANLLGQGISMSSLLAVGNTLFVGNSSATAVTEYDIVTGAAIGLSFDSGLGDPKGLAIWKNSLVVSNGTRVSLYNLTTGALQIPSILPPQATAWGSLAVAGDTLYMARTDSGPVASFDLAHFQFMNTNFGNTFGTVNSLAIATPEPGSGALVLLGGLALLRRRR